MFSKATEYALRATIFIAQKSSIDNKLLEMDATGIHVAQYLSELPSKELLQLKLQQAIIIAKHKLENKNFYE